MAIPHANSTKAPTSARKNKEQPKGHVVISASVSAYCWTLSKRTHYLKAKKKNTRKYDIRCEEFPIIRSGSDSQLLPLLHENLPSLHDSTRWLRTICYHSSRSTPCLGF
ncbi:hypothetical protein TNCT_519591 [Trichonephila clavata]|uniref:Uncharacterized protein n=2 Tax=Trichonephila TaxID=2585208 RepID=A0A8X6HDG8_TRICU|nr:hypothetical protein TNCT_519591 [Trichonephila clavata]GFY63313.1 hypothetical protein TNIN_311631 [Trichonephila inaurata madagascariensis]